MKKIIIATIAFFSIHSLAGEIQYGCHVLDPSMDNLVEGAIVRVENGKNELAYYLTSDTWGAVDEYVSEAKITAAVDSYVALSDSATLTIDLRAENELMQGEYPATLSIPDQKINAEMYCVQGEF